MFSLFSASRPTPSTRHTARLAGPEALETREVPAVSLANGTLAINGTSFNDKVTVTQTLGRVTVLDNGVSRSFPSSAATKGIVFHGGAGNDRFDNRTAIRVTAYGGSGNDVLFGGSGNDVLFGGEGNDALFGRGGVDRLMGEAGGDFLDSGSLSPSLADRAGLSGGDGLDFLAHQPVVNGTRPEDVQQGGTPTCGFHAAMAAVTRQGTSLTSRIRYLGEGQYSVRLFKQANGRIVPNDVRVSFNGTFDWFDAAPHARGQEGESWPLLMHRAFLQTRGVTGKGLADALSAGTWSGYTVAEVFLPVAGRAISLHDRGYWDGTWESDSPENLRRLVQAKAVVTDTRYTVDADLVGGHAYAVINVEQVNGQWAVTVYNPWGYDSTAPSDDTPGDGLVTLSWQRFTENFWYYYTA